MKNYTFEVTRGGELLFVGYGFGENAIGAFEDAVNSCAIILPPGDVLVVKAVCESGLILIFSAGKN